ncbi:glycoside hydrolase family 6 protein [Microbacterium sp. NPDC076911]|uniref:glycoside hydrolase family 6 protein n=1 Tax=Microbacterium sp. NPDC076911 TaxID=3154958 RepID=UPI003442DE00
MSVIIGAAIAAVLVVMIGVGISVASLSEASPPSPGDALMVAEESKARTASLVESDRDAVAAATYLADVPTAVWLTPESYPLESVRELTSDLLDEAKRADAAATLVIYGLPERDCGQYSAGGLDPDDYVLWTEEIALALADAPDVKTIIVLEPDSLALAPECGNVAERIEQLSDAADVLIGENVWLYVDGGHSNWLPASEMAAMISQIDGDSVRGFATNVSNYNSLAKEALYAAELSELLDGAHAVVDTSRSGAGSTGKWCNPPNRLIGEAPATYSDDVVDTNLWVKPPGESDGTCNGGPPAGDWWPAAAIELTRQAIR